MIGMSALPHSTAQATSPWPERVAALDWAQATDDLHTQGHAVLPQLLSAEECTALAGLYRQPGPPLFRSRVVMQRHGFGLGEYHYFSYPLPELVAGLRDALYPQLQPIANHWNAAMGIDVRYPALHADFIARCHAAGQLRPTPLLLQYALGVCAAEPGNS